MAEMQVAEPLDKSPEQAAEPPEKTTLDIATTDGDIIFALPKTRIRVSSVILSNASPMMKALFSRRWEGKTARSAEDPKEIALPDNDTATMTRLCRLLHHKRDVPDASINSDTVKAGARELLNLPTLSDKYQCTTAIQLASEYVLCDLCSLPESKKLPMDLLLNLLSATWTLQNDRYFSLITRRLALDFTTRYSLLVEHPAFQQIPEIILRKRVPVRQSRPVLTAEIVLLEEQRKTVWALLRLDLPGLAIRKYPTHGCNQNGIDRAFPYALASKVYGV